MSYNALDIAKYVVKYGNEMEYSISNLKLQKILYFIQAVFLVEKNDKKGCFIDKIEAWDFGPVVPSVYHYFKQYGNRTIPLNKEKENSCVCGFNSYNITDEDKELINQMVDACEDFSAVQLVEATHSQLPWKTAYKKGMNCEITKESIFNYFKGAN
ncbi:MAG: Panacea domain-containing protein [Aminipila sp.]